MIGDRFRVASGLCDPQNPEATQKPEVVVEEVKDVEEEKEDAEEDIVKKM